MKKFLSIVLVVAMMMTMSVTALAAENGTLLIDTDAGEGAVNIVPHSEAIEVEVRLDSDGDGIPDIDDTDDGNNRVLVVLSWTDMEFIYSKSWDGYAGEMTGEWADADQFISVTNRSTYEVTAAFDYTQIDTDYSIEFSVREMPADNEEGTVVRTSNAAFEGNVLTLENPTTATLPKDEDGNNILPWGEVAVNLAEGAEVPEMDSEAAVGTITVTIKATGYVPPVVEPSYDWYTIAGTDSYFEDEAGMNHNVTTNSFITFSMHSYPNSFDEDPTNDNYETTSVVCSDENVLESVTYQNENGYMFNTTGTYTVTVTFTMDTTNIEKTITFNVTEAE